MNQVSQVSFGTDITRLAGYAQYGNERLGNVDLIIENTDATASLVFQAKVASTLTASGFTNVGSSVTIVPGGVKTLSYNILGKKFGFFGSGTASSVAKSLTANVSIVFRNKGDLRGAQVDIVNVGRRGFAFDGAFLQDSIAKKWGAPPDQPTNPESDGYGGAT